MAGLKEDIDYIYVAWSDKTDKMGGLFYKYEDAVKSLGFSADKEKQILEEGLPVDYVDFTKEVNKVEIHKEGERAEDVKTLYLAAYNDGYSMTILSAYARKEDAANALKEYFELSEGDYESLVGGVILPANDATVTCEVKAIDVREIRYGLREYTDNSKKTRNMEAIQALCTRRSIKGYKTDMPSQDTIDQITQAGMAAPTGMGLQSPLIVVVKNKALRDELSKMNSEVLGVGSDPFYGAPACIVVLADKSRNTYLYDGSLVMGNMLNAAHALGLGACWIHRAKEVFATERGKQLLKEWGIEGDYEGIGHVVLGYPAVEPKEAKPRKDGYVRVIE